MVIRQKWTNDLPSESTDAEQMREVRSVKGWVPSEHHGCVVTKILSIRTTVS